MASTRALLSLSCACALVAQVSPPSQPTLPTRVQNGAFTEGELGQVPRGWTLPKPCLDAGFRAELVEDPGLPGKRCAQLSHDPGGASLFGNLLQRVDAAPFRGKRIRLRAQLRFETRDRHASGVMWLRVDRVGSKEGFFDNMKDRPVQQETWTPVEIVGEVAEDAQQISLGFMLTNGTGKLRMAPVTLEVLGSTTRAEDEGPRELSPQGLRNVEALSRALNHVRFFHPSDEAAKADWERLAPAGIRAVEGATSTSDLAARLQRFFAPYAPTAQFLTADMKPLALKVPPGATQVVTWVHKGYGRPSGHPIYRSTREYLPRGEAASQGWADPLTATPLRLNQELMVHLPTVCFAEDSKATLPKPTTPPSPHATEGGPSSAGDRATRLGAVALAWGVFQHFYPYFDVVGTDWDAELSAALRRAAEDPNADAFGGTLRRMVAALKDGHGVVSGSDSRGTARPALRLVVLDNRPYVAVTGEGAKEVPTGSEILSIDGLPAERAMQNLRAEISAATQGHMAVELAEGLLTGDERVPVKLTYRTIEGTLGKATLPRSTKVQELHLPSRPPKVTELRPGIWYVDLDRISEKDFEEAVPKLALAKGVVFDLRGYPRMFPTFLQHLTPKPVEGVRLNIPITSRPDRQGWTWITEGRWHLEPRTPKIQGKVAFLAGGGSMSFAESCLGVVEAYKLGEIVGEPTAGTNGDINLITLPGGFSIRWTGLKVLRHDGSTHHGVGILPTIPVKPSPKGLGEGRDEVLEKGLEVVSR